MQLILLTLALLFAGDVSKAETKKIRFPDVVPAPLPPAPQPKPDPAAQVMLNAGELYVVEGEAFEIRAFPANIVAVEKSGPVTVYGRFVGGTGEYEKRAFTGPTVAIVRAAMSGDVTLVVRPGDAKSEADWIDRAIRANNGPQPPPKPPEPIPPPKPVDPLTKALTEALAKDTAADRLKLPVFASVMARSAELSEDDAYTTNDELAVAVTAHRKAQVKDSLPNLRAAIGEYLNARRPTEVVKLTPELRSQFAAEYKQLSGILEAIK